MKPLRIVPIAEQVATHLREEVEQGILAGEMPGAKKLAARLGINHKTVDAAVMLLEKQGLLESQGSGKPRLIIRPKKPTKQSLRIAILTYEPEDSQASSIINEVRHSLGHAGHSCVLTEKSQRELKWDMTRIARMVEKTKADAWIVQAGSQEILEWFSQQSLPAIALYGRFLNIPIAAVGVLKVPAVVDSVKQLTAMGHRRIVMLSQESDRLPTPGFAQRVFLEQLESHGIQTSAYNLPNWESSPEGLQQALDSLFKLTPPTALFITDVLLLLPAYAHLLRLGIRSPEDISLICTDEQPQYEWCRPAIAHMRWDFQEIIHRIRKWANNISVGKEDKKQTFIDATFFPGGTIGPAP